VSASKKYHVRHILVRHRYEVDDLIKKLQAGAEFTELARKFSTCPSAPTGGDLGDLRLGQADIDFEEAALALKENETTAKPVRTRFGYHLIQRLK
jgi:peptidyl-prolyl cis-trans isomerase C